MNRQFLCKWAEKKYYTLNNPHLQRGEDKAGLPLVVNMNLKFVTLDLEQNGFDLLWSLSSYTFNADREESGLTVSRARQLDKRWGQELWVLTVDGLLRAGDHWLYSEQQYKWKHRTANSQWENDGESSYRIRSWANNHWISCDQLMGNEMKDFLRKQFRVVIQTQVLEMGKMKRSV